MTRIIFLAPFAKNEITGGVKTFYRHAELLAELGFDAAVFQPDGPPGWFETSARHVTHFTPAAGDVLVFPEVLNGMLTDMAQARFLPQSAFLPSALLHTVQRHRARAISHARF